MAEERASLADVPAARERALRALALASDGRDAEAVAAADDAAAIAPAVASVQLARAAVLREANRNAEALRAAERAVALDPEDARAHRERAAALAAMGRLQEARAAARRAAQLAPDDPAVLRRLADLALEVDPSEAERLFRRGVRRDPHSAAAHAGLARALRRLGRRDEADVEYERAAAEDPLLGELRERGKALFSAILQAAVATLVVVLMLGWLPDIIAVHHPAARGPVSSVVAALAVVGPVALLGWTALRVRRLNRDAPVSPDLREDLRDLAGALAER